MDNRALIVHPRQHDVINAIRTLTASKGFAPTLAEVARALGLRNRMTVHQHFEALRKKGLVTWEVGQKRTIRLVDAAPPPITGRWIRQGDQKWRWVK